MKDLSDEEKEHLERIINDLKTIFDKNRIKPGGISEIQHRLESDEVKNYLRDLREGSKPETALREELLAGNSTLANYILGRKEPEVSTTDGFIDYQTTVNNVPILVELKPLFIPVYKEESGQTVLKRLKESSLYWKDHQEQIEKYLRENEFLILTNLKQWYFFSKRAKEPINADPITFEEFNEDFKRIENLKDFLERFEESQTIRGGLDEHFFNNLDNWVSTLDSVEYRSDVPEEQRIESIINLINKFIFIQTLDDHFVIDFHWIRESWEQKERKWQQMGDKKFLSEFLGEINEWFYAHYDTELFRSEDGAPILSLLKDEQDNISKFYESLKRVLGLEHWQRVTSNRGITNYNYRQIDEDIFGKAYETYLAEVRKEQGIYYTPKYITQYIVEQTVGKNFDEYLAKIKDGLNNKEYAKTEAALKELVEIKVLDPACGSGSFLIKAVRAIWKRYSDLINILQEKNSKISQGKQTLNWTENEKELGKAITRFYDIIGYRPREGKDKRLLMSKLILRHIYGNDLDAKALSVAKVNIWLSAIKLIPKEYRYENISEGSGYSLPDLEINLGHGDSLVGLPLESVKGYLESNYSEKLQELSDFRDSYLKDPRKEELVEDIKLRLSDIRDELDEEFEKYLDNNDLPQKIRELTRPFYWPLNFWHVFTEGNNGFDTVIGNPPYVKAKLMNDKLRKFFDFFYKSSTGSYDKYVNFIERSLDLMGDKGLFGFINPSKFVQTDYGAGIRKYILNHAKLEQFVDFQDAQVFEDPTNYTCILVLSKPVGKEYNFRFSTVKNTEQDLRSYVDKLADTISRDVQIRKRNYNILTGSSATLNENRWDFLPKRKLEIMSSLERGRNTLEDYTYKVFVGAQITPVDVFEVRILEDREDSLVITPSDSGEGADRYEIEKDLVKPLLKSSDIEDYACTPRNCYIIFPYEFGDLEGQEYSWQLIPEKEMKEKWPKTHRYLLEHKDALEGREKGRWEDSDRWYEYSRQQNFGCHPLPKIVTPGIETSATFAADEGEFYIDRGSYGIIIDSEADLSRSYLMGLLNSKVLDFYLKSISPLVSGKYYAYQTKYLNQLPIQAESQSASEVRSLVKEVSSLRPIPKVNYKFWKEVSTKLRSDLYNLEKILQNDHRAMQKNNPDRSWTSSVSFYPSQENEILKESYPAFTCDGRPEECSIAIYGLEGQKEELLFEMEFKDAKNMRLIYLALKELFDSRKKVKTLQDILQKTEIPVIRPNVIDNSQNIMDEVNRRVESWYETQKEETPTEGGLIKVENKIQDFRDLIDAHVFHLYELSRDEVVVILDSLEVRESVKNDILKKFDKLG